MWWYLPYWKLKLRNFKNMCTKICVHSLTAWFSEMCRDICSCHFSFDILKKVTFLYSSISWEMSLSTGTPSKWGWLAQVLCILKMSFYLFERHAYPILKCLGHCEAKSQELPSGPPQVGPEPSWGSALLGVWLQLELNPSRCSLGHGHLSC